MSARRRTSFISIATAVTMVAQTWGRWAAMASNTGRLSVAVVAVFVFFVFWAAVAAHPWKSASPDPRLQVIAIRRQALAQESVLVNKLIAAHAAAVKNASAAKA